MVCIMKSCTVSGNCSSTAHRDHGLGLINMDTRHHSFINTMVHFHLILSFTYEDKHLQSFLLTLSCLRGSVGTSIPYLVVTAYLSVATSHHSYL